MVEMLLHLLYVVDAPGFVPGARYQHPDLQDTFDRVNWGLFVLDDDDQPIAHLSGLHELVLSTDPTGREGRPLQRS